MGGKRIAGLVLAAAAAWGLGASVAQAGDITFWTWRQEDKAAYTELFDDFTKLNPDIHVKFEAFAVENYQTIVSTALAGGKGGDVIHTRAYGGLEQFAKSGYLLPLDQQTVPELANLPKDALASETLRSDGKVYSLSFASQTLGRVHQQGRVRQGRRAGADDLGRAAGRSQGAEGQRHHPDRERHRDGVDGRGVHLDLHQPVPRPGIRLGPARRQDQFRGPALHRRLGEAARAARLPAARLHRHRLRDAASSSSSAARGDVRRRQLRDRELPQAEPEDQHGLRRPAGAEGRRAALRLEILRRRLRGEREIPQQGGRAEAGALDGHQGSSATSSPPCSATSRRSPA